MPPLVVAGRITPRGGARADTGVTRGWRGPVVRDVGDSSAIFSVVEEPNAGECHRHAVLVGRADHLHRDQAEITPRSRQRCAKIAILAIAAAYLGTSRRFTSASATDPPAATTYLTPRVDATSRESRKGKNASEASDTCQIRQVPIG